MPDNPILGKVIQIPDDLISKLDEMDKRINDIARDSEAMADKFKAAMGEMSGSADGFLKRLDAVKAAMEGAGAGGMGNVSREMKNAATAAETAANSITKAAAAVNAFGDGDMNIAELRKAISDINEELRKGGGVRPAEEQQRLVDIRRRLQEELKMQETSNQERVAAEQAADTRAYNNWLRLKDQEAKEEKRIEEQKRRERERSLKAYQKELEEAERQRQAWAAESRKAADSGEEYQANRRKVELMYRDMFDAIQREEDKANERRMREYERYARERAKIDSQNRRAGYADYVTTPEGSLRTADRARTYMQREAAIRNVEAAMKRLNVTDADYERNLARLSEAHKRLIEQQRNFSGYLTQINEREHHLMNTSQQLARSLALVFSVSQITGYVQKMVRVRGEFELQLTALSTILDNGERAQRLFSQITQLAVESPFTVKELTTYTKSLAAYQVEYENLYETTKMLADVSAGLGVDMQRLILAFGQVKAANFLRGTETRQFTEAGINMLGELAKYYTELEGRVVSVTEVQERQFKRMISFGDVEEVFKRLTSAGGMFYNMQEQQAETVAGLMSNLQDRIDLMFNELGKDNEGVIKNTIQLLGSLISNADSVANAVYAIAASLVVYKLNLALTNKALIRYAATQGIVSSSSVKMLSVQELLNVGLLRMGNSMRALGAAMKGFVVGNPVLLAITALSTAVYTAIHWNDELNESLDGLRKKFEDSQLQIDRITTSFKELRKEVKGITLDSGAVVIDTSMEYNKNEYKKQFANLRQLADAALDNGVTLEIPIEFITQENIDEQFMKLEDRLDALRTKAAAFAEVIIRQSEETDLGGLLGENLGEDMEDLSDAYNSITSRTTVLLDKWEQQIVNLVGGGQELTDNARDLYEELRKGQKEQETTLEWEQRRYKLLMGIASLQRSQYNFYLKDADALIELREQFNGLTAAQQEAGQELARSIDEFVEMLGGIEEFKKEYEKDPVLVEGILRMGIDKAFEDKELNEQAIRFANHYASMRLDIPVNLVVEDSVKMPEFFNDFRDAVRGMDSLGLFEDEDLEKLRSLSALEGELQKRYKANADELEVLNRASTSRLDLEGEIADKEREMQSLAASDRRRYALELQISQLQKVKKLTDEQTAAEISRITAEQELYERMARSFNLNLERQSSGSKGDPVADRLKRQISLIEKAAGEYEKYLEFYNKGEAASLTRDAFRDAFANVGLSVDMDFDPQGVVDALTKLMETAGANGKAILEEKIASLTTEITFEARQGSIDGIVRDFEDAMSGYELYLDFDSNGISPAVGGRLYGQDVYDLNGLKRQGDRAVSLLREYGDKGREAIEKINSDIREAEDKAMKAALDKFSGFLKDYSDQILRVQMQGGKDISFAKELFDTGKIDAREYVNIIRNIIGEVNKETGKIESDRFKDSATYIAAMGNVAGYTVEQLKRMADEIEGLINAQAANMEADDLEEYFGKLAEIRKAIESKEDIFPKNGFAQAREMLDLQERITEEREHYNELLKEQVRLEQLLKSLEETAPTGGGKTEVQNAAQGAVRGLAKVNGEMKISANRINEMSEKLDDLGGDSTNKTVNKFAALAKVVGEVNQQIANTQSLFSGIKEVADSFGADTDEGAWAQLGIAMESLGQAGQYASKAAASLLSGDFFGAAVNAVNVVGSLVSMFNKIHDQKRENQIQKEMEMVDNLAYAYDKLEKAIEDAYSFNTLDAAQEEALGNIDSQIAAYERMIALEKDKKDTDDERLKEWSRTIDDLYQQREDLQNQILEDLGGFGSASNFKSQAEQFVDAWLSAYQETGQGLEGLKEEFDSFFQNLFVKQATMKLVDATLRPFADLLDQYLSPMSELGSELSESELESIYDAAGQAADSMDKGLENLAQLWESLGFKLQDINGSDSLTGLQKGIQGVTEDTAQIVAALLESIRSYIAIDSGRLGSLYALLANPPAESPLFSQLKLQSEYLRLLNLSINSVITTSNNNGKVFKVKIV